MEFDKLYEIAKSTLNPRKLSRSSYCGSVAAAILTKDGNVYTGVCIDTPSSMGFCAEHVAISSMITNNESNIIKMVAVHHTADIVSSCDRCWEFINQIDDNNYNCEVMLKDKVVTISDLLPDSWS